MEAEPHQPTEQEVYDLLANLELAGLPSALIVTGLSPEVFKSDQAKVKVTTLLDDICISIGSKGLAKNFHSKMRQKTWSPKNFQNLALETRKLIG